MINAIFAIDEDGGMGLNGYLPWPMHKEDLAWFKVHTVDNIVVMGRGTWDSMDMPKPLPRRTNWVVTSKDVSPALNGAQIWDGDPYELCLKLEKENPHKVVWVIGGGKLLMSMAGKFDRMYVTHIAGRYSCDTQVDFAILKKGYNQIYFKTEFELDHVIYAKLSPAIMQDLI